MFNEDLYLAFVVEEAKKMGKVFMIDSGEGRDIIDEKTGWYIEDLSGWLILEDQKKEFLEARESNNAYELFGDEYVFVEWFKKDDLTVGVKFIQYPSY